MKSKKAQGLPLNTIVIAAIVLVVLVVLIMIFTGSMGNWTGNVKETKETFKETCLVQGGTLVREENLPEDYEPISANDDDPENGLFCIKY